MVESNIKEDKGAILNVKKYSVIMVESNMTTGMLRCFMLGSIINNGKK